MKKSLLLIGAVLLGMASSFMAMASGRGCYAETRAEGIALCERGLHQKAVEFFVAAKKCSDLPSNNDLDALIAACRSHMSGFSITKLEIGNTDVDDNELAPYGQAYLSSELFYLTPRITYSAQNDETITVGVKVLRPDGTLSGDEENEYSYTVDLTTRPGDGNTALLSGWGTNSGGSFEAGEYTVEVWVKGKLLATQKCTVIADPEPEPLVWVNGERVLNFTFPKQGGRRYIDVKTAAGIPFDYWGVPSFCKIENVTSKGFDLVCEPNKTPVYRSDYMGVTVNDGNDEARINVEQESYANPKKLLIDGKKGDDDDYITANFTCDGGREIFYVETDSPDYDFWGIPGFCTIESKTATSFFLVCEANSMTDERSDYFRVEAGKLKVTIYVNQAGNPNGESYDPWNGGDVDQSDFESTYLGTPNIISDPDTWIEILRKALANPTSTYSDGSCYKGLMSGGLRNGYGAYYWPVKSFYFGEWVDGERTGMGIYIIGDFTYEFTNCPGTKIYVGEFNNNQAHGTGTCYDRDGKLIYYGEFENGVPTGTYPNGDNYSGYLFQIVHMDSSIHEWHRWYIGETYGTQLHGWGVHVWDDFDSCFGLWSENKREGLNGQLFMRYDGSEIEMREYEDDGD